ncbi:MAG TPA: LacI family DNA-binding transcriptional regulator [Gemmatimonadaceae bacterium]|jgi:LacI family transcriptional regulator|nr:LacI family DNA-binding transcriptional regulator [Gemmatimonadaceae bacterium]
MVTIKDVAREAGVSVATVSRVYNDSELVSQETRQHVKEVGTRLRYTPNRTARSLTTAKTNSIGVLLPDIYGEFFSEVIRGIDESAQARDYHILVSSSHAATSEIDVALRSMRGRVDGLILMWPTNDAELVLPSLPDGFPVVLLNSTTDDGAFDSLTIDNYTGAHAMVTHLIALGHRKIAMILGAPGNHDASERLRGYRAALCDAGLALVPDWELPGDFSESSGWVATMALIERWARPTAIFAANDSMAIGAMSALGEKGLRVPDDIAVAGFDDIPMARYMNPPLSSVHVEIAALGAQATQMLLDRIERKAADRQHRTLPTRLVIRSSCGGSYAPHES